MRIVKHSKSIALFFVVTITLTLLCSPARGKEPLDGWKALGWRNDVSVTKGKTPELIWNFRYDSEPSVLSRPANTTWKKASGITCFIRSDREGQLFLRIDQNNGKIFLANFAVTKSWIQRTLSFADFTPFGNTSGNVEPSRIKNIYLVDLNGSESGASGKRTVFIRNMVLPKTVVNAQSTDIKIPLVAFDAKGEILTLKRFKARGTSGGRWCYLSDQDGNSIAMQLVEQTLKIEGGKKTVPAIIVNKDRTATLEVLYWPLNDTYKVRLQADGNGKGIQNALTEGLLLVNMELAKTRFQILSNYSGGIKGPYSTVLKKFELELSKISQDSNLRRQAKRADELLIKMLDFSQEAVRRKSATALTNQLTPGKEITIPTPEPKLLKAGHKVTIKLEDPAFRIGMGQGFGFVTNKVPAKQIDDYYSRLRMAGFNMVTLPLYWDQVVDNRGKETSWQRTLRFDTLAHLGYSLHAHGFVQSGMPSAVHKLKGNDFLDAAKQHTARLAKDLLSRYGEQIVLWQAVNEPASNRFGDSSIEDRIDMVAELINHMRETLPEAKVVVNDYDWERGIEAGKTLSSRSIIGTLPFFREMLKKKQKPDLLAVEWYPGARVERPEFRVDLSEPCMDLLDTSLYWDRLLALGLPLIFTESNFPGRMKNDDLNGYAWGRWDTESQAEAAIDTFILALSKPDIWGWVWWSITDREPWNRSGGLFTAKGSSKPVLTRLTAEINALKKPRQVTVKNDGKLSFPMLPGIWRISIDGGPSWLVKYDREEKVSIAQSTSYLTL